jgi:hypothetical protein
MSWALFPKWRRFRGVLIRVAFDRRTAAFSGVTLALLSGLLLVRDYVWETWITDGLGLILSATGAALLVMALWGNRRDWTDFDRSS